MSSSLLIGLLLLGLFTGVLSGMLGIGGGLIVVPALVLIFHLTQKQAVATSLAMMLPPVGIFAVLTYYHANQIRLDFAIPLAAAFVIGALASSWLITHYDVPDILLRRIFAFLLIYAAGQMLFRADPILWAAFKTLLILIATALLFLFVRAMGKKWERFPSAPNLYAQQRELPFDPDFQI